MYPCSQRFHDAVANGNEQKALLIFSDCVFTDDDIDVTNGIQFRDYFNTEEDLSIGQALSNEISFTLFNDDRLLNDYEFGEFTATLGVKVSETPYSQTGVCMVLVGNDRYVANSVNPFIKKNGTALATQPTQRINSMLAYNGKLYCFGKDENYAIVYDQTTGNVVNETVNDIMKHSAYTRWNGKGIWYGNRTENGITIHELDTWKAGTKETYEFVPLGVFIADRPNAPDRINIDMTCYDLMQKFDEDWDDSVYTFLNNSTISGLFIALCNNVLGANRYILPNPFINGTAKVTKKPDDFDAATKRDVMKWIAEAACANARINRDGYMILDWLKTTGQSYAANGYSEFNPYWYETKKVTKLYNRDTQESADHVYGDGDEAYLIQDNPLLKGVS